MNILFEIKYTIKDSKREDYLNLLAKIKEYYKKDGVDRYMTFEDEKKKNEFTEIFLFASESDFEKFEEGATEEINDMLSKLVSEMVVDKKIKYRTKKEV
jgi:quinol monooxygenase YgiN